MTSLPLLMARDFGLAPDALAKTQGGWTADAYAVETGLGRFFLKIYDGSRPSILPWIKRIDSWLPAFLALCGNPLLAPHLPRPHPAPSGAFLVRRADKTALLFSFIEGETLGEKALSPAQAAELANIVAALHQSAPGLGHSLGAIAEDLSLAFLKELKDPLASTQKTPPGLTRLIKANATALSEACETLTALRNEARAPCARLAVCHADLHGWNLMQGDKLYLLDWEGLVLAPPEADLFMLRGSPREKDFFDAYRQARPGFAPDERLIAYYRLRRTLEDLWDFIVQVRDDPLQRPEELDKGLTALEDAFRSLCRDSSRDSPEDQDC